MDERAISPLMAILLLLTFVLVIGAVLMGTIFGFPRPVPRYEGEFIIENVVAGRENLKITHTGGPACHDAFSVENSVVTWKNLELRIQGVTEGMKCSYATSEGSVVVNWPTDNSEPPFDLVVGDVFVINVKGAFDRPLESGDAVALIYTPKNQTLVLTRVPST